MDLAHKATADGRSRRLNALLFQTGFRDPVLYQASAGFLQFGQSPFDDGDVFFHSF